ncbi:MHC class II regulatory factor RFX1a isoform X6 [Scyliorhinus canicula]|uniref:MHC class II regulatory factor RFX1a isoform X6 n=1 Tax=Scyliorhinus canicula TaxID=7830 RepID=UPI0018F4CE4E|nr:MHC class II regulatory factor RFX1a isoform X6 [Scyliorhinus canicula]
MEFLSMKKSVSNRDNLCIMAMSPKANMRPTDTGSDSSSSSAGAPTGVPTQVVQQVQASQQRLLVQNAVQSKVDQFPQLQLPGVQQVAVMHQRSVVQTTPQAAKTSQVQQLSVQALQQVHVTQESTENEISSLIEKNQKLQVVADSPSSKNSIHEEHQLGNSQALSPEHKVHVLHMMPSTSAPRVEVIRFTPQHLPSTEQKVIIEQVPFFSMLPASPEQRVKVQRVPQALVFGTGPTALKVQQLQQVPVQPVQHVYSNQVQYVEGGDASYTGSTIRSNTYPYSDTQLYSQNTSGSYYESQGTPNQVATPVTSQNVVSSGTVPMYVTGGQIVANPGGGTYVIQGGYMLGSSSQSYSHTMRASPATVQWLLDNYETAEGVSLPRSTLYCHYLLHCQEQKLEPVNAASFGKLIRSVFMGLRTRRLGTRGNSKYHYYGLRIKANSPLIRLIEDQQHLAIRQQPFTQKQSPFSPSCYRLKPIQKVEGMTNGMGVGQQQGGGLSDISAQVQQYQQFLDASRALPEFVEIDLQGKTLPDGMTMEHVKAFQLLYREHCEAILDVMVNLQFTLVETLWKTFWRYNTSQSSDGSGLSVHDEAEKRLPKSCLVLLCKYEPSLKWTKYCDNMLYQGLVEILIPDVLRPIPSALTQAIRNFAKSLESWLTNAMMNVPEEMVRVKVAAASAFAQTLRRYTSLNHLAQAARAVLQNTAQINQMLSDLNRVDFANVQEQASWVCRCEDGVVQRLEQDFKMTLQQQNSLEQWASWLDSVVTQVLKPYHGSPSFPKAAKQFLLKWSFYSSMVIRDLTLRSAASFGSFHLIRLLYDEYMYYLIEHRVAQAKGETPIAVMGEFADLGRALNPLDPDKDEEEEEEESDDDSQQEIPMDNEPTLVTDPMEPPAKLPRTDSRGVFVQAPPTN